MTLDPQRWREIEAAFEAALDLPETLNDLDPEMRREVEAMLAADGRAHEAVASAVAEGHRLLNESNSGRRFGPYRVTSILGHGGMGAVYRAIRDDRLFEKEVAIKVVRLGLDTPDALNRFRQERKILAGLEHPGIARLLDGGETEDGQPWIAMEFVEGVTILDFARERQLGLHARLRLFLGVCAGVQYAHGQLIVHRDLKPANILVTLRANPSCSTSESHA